MIGYQMRTARRDDLDEIARFIETWNRDPHQKCLGCDEDAPSIRASLDRCGIPAEEAIVVAHAEGRLVGVVGCDLHEDLARGWLWGPFVEPDHRDALAGALLASLLPRLPASLARIDTFTHVENHRTYELYLEHGFRPYKTVHIYCAPRPATPLPDLEPCPDLEPGFEDRFAALHALSFPGAATPAAEILAERDERHRIFAVTGGPALLGYLHATVHDSPLEGFVEYVAVHPDAQRRGLGARLLFHAMRWFFETLELPQVGLCVDDTNVNAQSLYERVGFRLLHTGEAARWERAPGTSQTSPTAPGP